MAKHVKCEDCKGYGKKLVDEVDYNGRPYTIELKCTTCNGTGWAEKNKNSGSDVVVLGK